MTDKQIIIDGIDVSKCKYIDIENFEKPMCPCITQRNECERPCEDKKNCYYKQLARAKQEDKKLEKIVNKSAERFCNDYLETFKENERLKSELQAKELELIMAKADLCRGCQYKNDYKAKEQECEELKVEVKKQKEIAKEYEQRWLNSYGV